MSTIFFTWWTSSITIIKMHQTAVICLVLASLAATCCLAQTVETVDVVIVGAGSAGLYAARDLAAKGYAVKVLEASDRHGGRVLSTTLGVTRLDMGAEFVVCARLFYILFGSLTLA